MEVEAKAIATVRDSDLSRREIFLRLFAEYGAAMRRLAAVYVNDVPDREDMVQEIAVALWQAIPKFRGEASERTWLYRIAHNTAITASAKLWRRGRTESAIDDLAGTHDLDSAASLGAADLIALKDRDGDERLIESQKREWLMRAIRELGAVDRQIVTLHLEELSYHEIQEITGMTEGAIATRLTRIREKLAEQIRKQEVELR
jgi:RNA polymerase sigma factor (sigma-70 family)